MSRSALLRRGVALEWLTIAWNVLEALVALVSGFLAGSIALLGFGLDSVIETVAAIAVKKRLTAETGAEGHGDEARERAEEQERRALRVVGMTFYLLAGYIFLEAGWTLWKGGGPKESLPGIILAALSLAVMPILGLMKLRTGKALGSAALVADSKETFICAYLSFTLLLGLLANALLGWWWADPLAALAMVPLIVKEGREAFEGEGDD